MPKFPSTLLAQIASKTEPKEVEREVQKADLDLLSKINQLAGGDVLSVNQQDYTEKPGEAYDLLSVTTGCTSRTVTLSPAKQVSLRQRTYAKADSGAGEVVLKCQGTDVIYYAGGSASTMYVGSQNQSTTLLAIPGGFLLIGGVTQPVSGESSLGTLHLITNPALANLYNTTFSSLVNFDVDASGLVQLGTRGLYLSVLLDTTANAATNGDFYMDFRPKGSSWSSGVNRVGMIISPTINGTAYRASGTVIVGVDNSRKFQINAACPFPNNLARVTAVGYFI